MVFGGYDHNSLFTVEDWYKFITSKLGYKKVEIVSTSPGTLLIRVRSLSGVLFGKKYHWMIDVYKPICIQVKMEYYFMGILWRTDII